MKPIILEHVQNGDRQLLFDGFLRSLAYLEKFDQLIHGLRSQGNDIRMLHLYLDTSESVSAPRFSTRREGEGRPLDNNSDIALNKARIFNLETIPMLNELRRRGNFYDIEGNRDKDEIAQDINKIVSIFLAN